MNTHLTINEVAVLLDRSVETIRKWDEKLLPTRDENGHRQYDYDKIKPYIKSKPIEARFVKADDIKGALESIIESLKCADHFDIQCIPHENGLILSVGSETKGIPVGAIRGIFTDYHGLYARGKDD